MNAKLIHGDCLEEMPKLIDEGIKVDLVLTDPPYGTIKGLTLNDTKNFKKELVSWDNPLPIKPMFKCCDYLLKKSRCCILFSNQRFTFELYNNQITNLPYIYSYVWLKNEWGNHFMVNKAPLKKTEDILVFKKIHDNESNERLREYAEYIFNNIGLSKAEIDRKMGNQKANHFFRFGGFQFSIPSREGYDDLIKIFHIDEFDGYLDYDTLCSMKGSEKSIFNLNGANHKTNVLEYDKVKYQSLHPTQKPVDLLEDLILTYSNEGDTVLDFTMGSGSTGVACMNTNRNFIGIEKDVGYYNIAEKRIKDVVDDEMIPVELECGNIAVERCKSYQSNLEAYL